MMNQKIILFLSLVIIYSSTFAENKPENYTLTIDESIADNVQLNFSEDKILLPESGEFKIMSSILMSNPSGERWATITLKNLSTYQRLLDKEHIIAIFANGERRYPAQAKQKFDGKEEITMLISFGESKFPILRLIIRN